MSFDPTTTPHPLAQRELLTRLRAVRRTGAAVAVCAGLSQAVLVVLGGGLAAMALDWLLRFPGPLRLAVTLALVVLIAVTVSRRVLARLASPPLWRVARQVQDALDGPPDCLASGAQFAAAGLTAPFAQQTVARAADLAHRLSPARLARWRWMLGWLAGALLAIAFLTVAWPTVGWWIECGLARLAWPVAHADWPRRVHILSDQSGKTLLAAVAEPVTFHARIARGPLGTDARLVLAEAGHVRRVDMTDAGEGRRSATVQLLSSATFWFEAGDDETRATPGRIRVVPRPAVSRAEILVQPPPYTNQPASRITLGSGPVQVPEASRVDLDVTVTKPVANDAGRPAATMTLAPADAPDARRVESLDVRFGPDPRQISAGWSCTRDSLITVHFTDTDGLANAPIQPWRIGMRLDQLPAVQVQSPPDAIDATPNATLRVQAAVRDDWGVDDVDLAWHVTRAASPETPRAAESPPSPAGLDQLQRIPTTQPHFAGEAMTMPIDWPWNLEGLSLQPGDRLTWSVRVRDNFDLPGRRHDPVLSPPRTVRVVSPAELLESVLRQLADARTRILQMLRQQRDLRGTLLAEAAASRPAVDASNLRRSIQQQAQIAGAAASVAADLAADAARLRANLADRRSLAESVAAAANRLSGIRAGPMADVQRSLQAALASAADRPPTTDDRASPRPADRTDAAAETSNAARGADAAARSLEDLLQRTAGWTSLESAAFHLEDLIDKQKALHAQTADLASRTIGQPVRDLPDLHRDALARLADEQRALAERTGRLQQDMKSQATAGEQLQAEQRARLEDAAASLEARNTVPTMAAAANEIADNVTMSAQQRQLAACVAMEQALAALGGRTADDRLASAGAAGDPLARRLRELAARQITLRAQTGDINARRDPAGQLDRAGLLRLNQAGNAQADLAGQVRQVQPSAEDQAAQQVLATVSSRMQTVAQDMHAGSSGPPVLDAQQRAADALLAFADVLDRAAQARHEQQGAEARAQPGTPVSRRGDRAAADSDRQTQPSSDSRQSDQGGQRQAASGSRDADLGGSQAAADEYLPGDQAAKGASALPAPWRKVEAWGFLPPDRRREVLQGMHAEPPPRYRKLTERYWQLLNESAGQ
jgi:hypothetical protein